MPTGFRIVLLLIAIGGLLALGYQLTDDGLCILRRSWTCISGPNAWLAASGFAFLCGASALLAFDRTWSSRAARACIHLSVACFVLVIPVALLT
jgi:hypothetical protein